MDAALEKLGFRVPKVQGNILLNLSGKRTENILQIAVCYVVFCGAVDISTVPFLFKEKTSKIRKRGYYYASIRDCSLSYCGKSK